MLSRELVHSIIEFFVEFATDNLLPVMILMWIGGFALRALIFFTVKREDWFARQFEKRTLEFLDHDHDHHDAPSSFYVIVKKLLEKTYYEIFEVRAILKRRRPDIVMTMSDRVFLIQHGCAILVKDTLKQVRYLKHEGTRPKLLEISKNVFMSNPCFSKVFGVFPASMFNDVLNILPGLFIIGGIFGTFLGIMKALPELGGMNLENPEQTKMVMDGFLVKIAFSMQTSIIGIILSVALTVFNTIVSPEKLFVNIVERYENALDNLWNLSKDNLIPSKLEKFDADKDPLEALAEEALNKEINKGKKARPRETTPPVPVHPHATVYDEINNQNGDPIEAESINDQKSTESADEVENSDELDKVS